MLVHRPTGVFYETRKLAKQALGQNGYKKAERRGEIVYVTSVRKEDQPS